MTNDKKHKLFLTAGFLVIIFGVGLVQAALELSRREQPQFLDLFLYKPTEKNLRRFESRLEKPFYSFLLILVKKHRVQYLPEIIEHLDILIRENKGLAVATCITAKPITDKERTGLIERLHRKTSLKIELDERVDPSVIGGMTVLLRNQIIDGSVKFGLNQLKNRLMKVKVH